MLADFQTMHEASDKDYRDISYAFMGDLRFNMGRSHLVTAALLGSDIRLVGPRELVPPADVVKTAKALARGTGARITITDDVEAGVKGVDFIHTDVWVSMGESKDVWNDRVALLKDYQVSDTLMGLTGNADTKFMHCLPAFHDANTVVGAEMMETTGMPKGLEVTNDVFESPASLVFDQAENRLHTIKAIMVATLGS
jgi:ornithine carbamoyltransferase